MDTLLATLRKTGDLHHAYLIEGEVASVVGELALLLESAMDITTKGNPDYWQSEVETFGIEEGRALAELQGMRAVGGERKIFVIGAQSMTHEAQNSLLKVFEEPTRGTYFFLVMPSADRIIPTLASRLQIVRTASTDEKGKERAKKFLASNPSERAEALKLMIEEKDKELARRFLESLQSELLAKVELATAKQEEVVALGEISKALSYLKDRSPSIKIILEHVSNVTPLYR